MRKLSELWRKTKTALSSNGAKKVAVRQDADDREQLADRPLAAPPVDVYENDKELLVVADVPGASRQDALVSVDDGDRLVIYAAAADRHPSGADWYRSLVIPAAFDARKARASLAKGTLELRIPRKKASAPKLIPVRSSG